MPGADELFRSTTKSAAAGPGARNGDTAESKPAASGRVKHDEKITVYVTAEELMALEQTRLAVRAVLGHGVDRGRIVRAALAAIIEDFEARGPASELIRRVEGPAETR